MYLDLVTACLLKICVLFRDSVVGMETCSLAFRLLYKLSTTYYLHWFGYSCGDPEAITLGAFLDVDYICIVAWYETHHVFGSLLLSTSPVLLRCQGRIYGNILLMSSCL